jgi:hypothetical protein
VNVPEFSAIKIYTLAGDLVWEGEQRGAGGNVEWDVKNGDDELVASGVYLYRVETPSGDSVFGRIVVIR